MKNLWIRFWRAFGFYPKPIEIGGIYGVTEDGCYLVLGRNGVVRKTPPINRLPVVPQTEVRK